jgi:hypothetical protein
MRQKMELVKTVKLRQTVGLGNKVRLMKVSKFFMKETSTVNEMCNMFSDVHFNSCICSKGMKLIHKTHLLCRHFPLWDSLTSGITTLWGKCSIAPKSD